MGTKEEAAREGGEDVTHRHFHQSSVLRVDRDVDLGKKVGNHNKIVSSKRLVDTKRYEGDQQGHHAGDYTIPSIPPSFVTLNS